jgi:hypothetical protein
MTVYTFANLKNRLLTTGAFVVAFKRAKDSGQTKSTRIAVSVKWILFSLTRWHNSSVLNPKMAVASSSDNMVVSSPHIKQWGFTALLRRRITITSCVSTKISVLVVVSTV